MHFATANSRFEAYGHEVTIGTLGIEVHSLVFFFADANIVKNVLGRRGWLDRLNVGIVGQTIVLCRLPALPEGGRPRSTMVCPTTPLFFFQLALHVLQPGFQIVGGFGQRRRVVDYVRRKEDD